MLVEVNWRGNRLRGLRNCLQKTWKGGSEGIWMKRRNIPKATKLWGKKQINTWILKIPKAATRKCICWGGSFQADRSGVINEWKVDPRVGPNTHWPLGDQEGISSCRDGVDQTEHRLQVSGGTWLFLRRNLFGWLRPRPLCHTTSGFSPLNTCHLFAYSLCSAVNVNKVGKIWFAF